MGMRPFVGTITCGRGRLGPRGRARDARTALFVRAAPGHELIEDDGAESCGAHSSHRERAELQRKVAGAGRRRHGDGEMNSTTETGSIVPDALAALPRLKPTEN
jgi:hypothetical protein